jgi:hypothetical protein
MQNHVLRIHVTILCVSVMLGFLQNVETACKSFCLNSPPRRLNQCFRLQRVPALDICIVGRLPLNKIIEDWRGVGPNICPGFRGFSEVACIIQTDRHRRLWFVTTWSSDDPWGGGGGRQTPTGGIVSLRGKGKCDGTEQELANNGTILWTTLEYLSRSRKPRLRP